ncbi:TonB-dependent receptor domain-containing protein [Psychrobacter sp. I-STPA6b]|uniref:TonB-dependent receptor domain-containing protein n=1 Tax=Psychrobacter sp. I-STPA6b TaxID=2585718 RepID=UPI001D0C8578|nr:TonB-dependent receptor [Psychrobacter sp. I-STPA6b]
MTAKTYRTYLFFALLISSSVYAETITNEPTTSETNLPSSSSSVGSDDLVLDAVRISAKDTANQVKKTFTTAGAVSTADKEKIDRSVTGLDSVVRALPGSFTYMDTPQGTLSVNVRGMTGFGRVNTMIDGVPQTLFGVTATSEGDGGFHDSPASTSTFGTAIDPNFLVGADINRGGQGGSHGVNALMGSANFRTIGVDDIILGDNSKGILAKYSYGTNKLGHDAMVAVASRYQTKSMGDIGAMLAISGANKSTDYRRGDGKLASSNTYVISKVQKPRSYLAKLELEPAPNHDITLSTRDYKTNIGGRELQNTTYGIDYHYTPESDWLDLGVKATTTKNTQALNRTAKYFLLEDAKSQNRSNYFDINNTSYFYLPAMDITSTYGISYLTNDYSRQATAVNEDNYNYTTFSPSGEQKILSYYLNNNFKKDIYEMDLSLSRVDTKFSGHKPACDSVSGITVPCFPQGASELKNNHVLTNGKIQLSANINDWFSPFVSYSRTSRMPNIQEVFFNNEGGGSMNPYLKPEQADIKEIGFNTFKHGIFDQHDSLGFKAVYFNSKIKDYIHSQSFFLKQDGHLTDNLNEDISEISPSFHAQISVNSLEPVVSKGYEVQANYTHDKFFGALSYTNSTSNQPVNINSGFADFGFSGGALDRLPETYWTLDLGTNLLDNKLQLGTSLKYYGKNLRLRPDGTDIETSNYHLQEMPKAPIVTDLHASYQMNKNILFRLGVENLFNKLYIHPLNSQNSDYSQLNDDGESYSYTNYARGRTIKVGAEFKF